MACLHGHVCMAKFLRLCPSCMAPPVCLQRPGNGFSNCASTRCTGHMVMDASTNTGRCRALEDAMHASCCHARTWGAQARGQRACLRQFMQRQAVLKFTMKTQA